MAVFELTTRSGRADTCPMAMAERLSVALALGLLCASTQAQSLRCNGHIAQEGDSRLSVLYKCGEPLLQDSYCAPVYQPQSPYPVPEPWAGAIGCQRIDEWLYDRGPGNMIATVRFRGGVVQSIRYGRVPE